MHPPNDKKAALVVWYYGTYDRDSSRNKKLIKALRENGCEVVEIHRQLWSDTEHKIRAMKSLPVLVWTAVRWLGIQYDFLKSAVFMAAPDVIVIGYNAYQDIFSAKLLAWIKQRPLVFDITVPLILMIRERGVLGSSSLLFRLSWIMEWLVLKWADSVLVETHEEAGYLCKEYGFPLSWHAIPVGVDPEVFKDRPKRPLRSGFPLSVVYHGSFIPQHGTTYLIQAIHLLKSEEDQLTFTLVGDGQSREECRKMAADWSLDNVHFPGRTSMEELVFLLGSADICVGVFGSSPQAMMSAHNKLFEALAVEAPLVTAKTPVTERLFENGKEALLVEAQNPEAIAAALRLLMNDRPFRERMGRSGYEALFAKGYVVKALGAGYAEFLNQKAMECGPGKRKQ